VPTEDVDRHRPQLRALTFNQVLARGQEGAAVNGWTPPRPSSRQDLVSLAFTSGTSGKPKVGRGEG